MENVPLHLRPSQKLWLDSCRGIYIPRDFANCFKDRASTVRHVSAEDWAILEAGPDHESYWDVWSEVIDNAVVYLEDNHGYTLYQEGDLWLIPQGMEWNEDTDTYDWPDRRGEDDED